MPIEIIGQQLRIRIKDPKQFIHFATKDVGESGKLQLELGENKKHEWILQAYKINLNDYYSKEEAINEVRKLKISSFHKRKSIALINKYFN
jgi:hypothetical protein